MWINLELPKNIFKNSFKKKFILKNLFKYWDHFSIGPVLLIEEIVINNHLTCINLIVV